MRAAIIAVGRLKDGPERLIAARYHERAEALGRRLGVAALDLVEIPESRARREADRRAEEAEAILRRSTPAAGRAALVAFDERGESPTSEAFAAALEGFRGEGRALLGLVIGGPDGLDAQVRDRADRVLSFGRLTLPHGLVRVLVAEQVYRAWTILARHPYHRSGEP